MVENSNPIFQDLFILSSFMYTLILRVNSKASRQTQTKQFNKFPGYLRVILENEKLCHSKAALLQSHQGHQEEEEGVGHLK